MRIRKLVSGFFAMVLCLVMLFACSVSAIAAGTIDMTRKASLTLSYVKDGVTLQSADVRLYRVADINSFGEFTLADSFKDYSMNLTDIAASEWKAAAETLSGYAIANDLEPVRTDKTNENGEVVFSNLNTGLYLVITKPVTVNGYVYKTEDFLISLPSLDESDAYVYDVTANPKISSDMPSDDETRLTVVKKWADAGYETNRPAKVTVELYRNELLFDTQILSSANNWTYGWTVPEDGSTWRIVEKNVDAKYTASVSVSGETFTVTNSYKPSNPHNPNLPQTGQLWWPIAAMAGGGILLFIAGWFMVQKRKNESKK